MNYDNSSNWPSTHGENSDEMQGRRIFCHNSKASSQALRSSVDMPITSANESRDYHLQYERSHGKNSSGARPKNFNSYKQFNSFANTDEMKKESTDFTSSHDEYLDEVENNRYRRFNTESNEELLCREIYLNETHPGKNESNDLKHGTNYLIPSNFCTKESSEIGFKQNIIDGDQNASNPCFNRIESSNNKEVHNNTILYERHSYETTPVRDEFLFSSFNDVHHTTPKIINRQNEYNLLSNMNDKTEKLYSSVKSKFSPSLELKQYNETKKSALIKYAKDIADLILGCGTALSVFKSSYDEWSAKRSRSIDVLEQIVVTFNTSSRKGQTIKAIISAINLAADVGDVVSPNKLVSMGFKIAGAIAGVLQKLVGNDVNKKDLEEKEFKIKDIFQQDMDLSSLVYIFGMQCGTQFQETCSLIKKFHQMIQSENFTSVIEDEDVIEFLNEISEYNPSNFVFYKRLKLGYEKLMLSSKSKESKAFYRDFEDVPDALNTINLLLWKFDTEGFDHTIVEPYWQKLFDFLCDSESKNVDDFLRKVQECLYFLRKERSVLKHAVLNLFKDEHVEKNKI